jgi:hypothetical protein
VSGFLSEDTDKAKEWIQLLEYDNNSEIFALQWSS